MTAPLRPALQKFRTALNALYLEVEPSIANDIVDLANAALVEAEAYARAARDENLPVDRPCSACQGNHFDHTFVHFSLSNDLGGFCWEEDHYPNEGDILVTSNISEVTCPKCREYCQTLNELKKSEGFGESPAAAPAAPLPPAD